LQAVAASEGKQALAESLNSIFQESLLARMPDEASLQARRLVDELNASL
jgi:hypothetical protein